LLKQVHQCLTEQAGAGVQLRPAHGFDLINHIVPVEFRSLHP
jgi:hypothetical protein